MSNNFQEQTEIPEQFIDQIKDALENLYDFPALQQSPLVKMLGDEGAHGLRRKLIEAIETLNPSQKTATSDGATRIYNLVYLHYVAGQTLQEVALEIGVSRRQAYRDLRRGHERVGAVLWYSERKQPLPEMPEPAELSAIETEVTRLEGSMTTVPLQQMLESTLRTVQKLADKHDIQLDVQAPQNSILLTTNPAIAQQVLTHILSQVIQQITPPYLRVSLDEESGSPQIILAYEAESASFAPLNIDAIIEHMMNQIRWKIQYRTVDNERHLILRSVQTGALVLIIDDNQGLVDLLQRYFTGNTYRVISTLDSEEGLRLAQKLLPDAIILDLMMPNMDGWELLQRLRTHSDTQNIPVIICSVINDPELAYSLGASKFVPKPVTKETLLAALRDLQI